jgi:hypothetical protein
VKNKSPPPHTLPSTSQLLIAGGDERNALNPSTGLNKYGCQPFPDPQLLAFGSSTASVISDEGYAVANQLREQLVIALNTESHQAVFSRKMQELRLEWLQLCEISDFLGLELIFSPSGTETHAIATQLTGSNLPTPALVIMVEANETGSGVVSALNEKPCNENNNIELVQVSIRLENGMPRLLAEIDAEVETLVAKAVASDRRVLLILVDQSKTGLIAPSPACVMALHSLYPNHVEVLVDACQFRIGLPTLRAYLEQGFMVALTGSKFLTAPSFSAVLLLPANVAERLQKRAFPRGLIFSSSRAHWPENWMVNPRQEDERNLTVRPELVEGWQSEYVANFGLLLRLAVALEELRRFRTVPQSTTIDFLRAFAEAIHQRLSSDPHFEPLPVTPLDRRPLIATNNWDHLQTIFPFLLYSPLLTGRIPLNREQTGNVYQQLQSSLWTITLDHTEGNIALICCQLGQPVACGTRNGTPVSALRLCLSSRLIVEAITQCDQGLSIIDDALKALDKTAWLIEHS